MRGKHLISIVLLAVLGLATGTGTALAHDTLVHSDPADGAQLAAGPAQMRLIFDQPVRGGYDTVTVRGPGNTYWTTGPASVRDNTVTVPLGELGPSGQYVIGYRILSNDGHPVTGKLTFTLTQPGHGRPVPPPEGDDAQAAAQGDPGMPVWPWIAGAVVLVAVGLVLALRLGRERR